MTSGTITIQYDLQVENILANQEGDTLNNVADLFYTDEDGVTQNTVSDADDTDTIVTLVEPDGGCVGLPDTQPVRRCLHGAFNP